MSTVVVDPGAVLSFTSVNVDKGWRFGEDEYPLKDTYGANELEDGRVELEVGVLYRRLVSEYGRCTGKVYVDRAGGEPSAIGWVFVSREKYEDTGEPYLRETWVTLGTRTPSRLTHVAVRS